MVELLLAVALAGLVGSAALTMLVAATSATSLQSDSRRATVARQLAAERLGSLVRSSRAVLRASTGEVLLWKDDPDADGIPELSEMLLVQWDSSGSVLKTFQAPTDSALGSGTAYPAASDFADATTAAATTLPSRVLLRHVDRFEATPDAVPPQMAKRIRIQTSVETDHGTESITIIATPRGAL
jgi:hypothetical protein